MSQSWELTTLCGAFHGLAKNRVQRDELEATALPRYPFKVTYSTQESTMFWIRLNLKKPSTWILLGLTGMLVSVAAWLNERIAIFKTPFTDALVVTKQGQPVIFFTIVAIALLAGFGCLVRALLLSRGRTALPKSGEDA
jgi:hypothetical protein